jgi:sphingomyelin phosphodiesterase acid-like 3
MTSRFSPWILFTLLTLPLLPSFTFADPLPWGSAPVSTQGTFLMMSDLHFDPFADPKLVPDLIKHPVEDWEGILNGSKVTTFAPYGNDSNWPLLLSALKQAQSLGPYDYAIFTGDYLVHKSRDLFVPFGGKDEKAYEDFVTKAEVFVTREVQKNLPNMPIYFCLGNNDSECGDYMIASHSDFLERLSTEWGVLLGRPEAVESFVDQGNYVVPHPTVPGMELVVLNDVYWSNRFESDSCHPESGDPGQDEMNWLQNQLENAKDKNLKVQLVMHIPPTADVFSTFSKISMGVFLRHPAQLFWDRKYEKAFVKLLKDYQGVLVSGFAGHTHMDDFRVLNQGPGTTPFFIHICPAISPIRGNNPGFQVALYDKGTGAMLDMATYDLTNLETALSASEAKWALEYDFDSAYTLSGYNGSALSFLADEIQTTDAVRQNFSLYYRGSAPATEKGKYIPDDAWKILNSLHTQWTENGMNKALDAALAGQGAGK